MYKIVRRRRPAGESCWVDVDGLGSRRKASVAIAGLRLLHPCCEWAVFSDDWTMVEDWYGRTWDGAWD
ncbi:MAG TPA: hypothetical protein VJV23_03440 [Candidatus Polarisedimenticolia bacterium]|nr:hypothetical protein [Candidatus Polarisedimenticolia bacterium]